MKRLPEKLYSVDSVVRLEQFAINQSDIPAYALMKRAGQVVFDVICSRYPQHKNILVLCGAGNNAGDGYVVATLARQAGFNVNVISLIDPARLKAEASLAYQDWLDVGANHEADLSLIEQAAIVIDAMLGTGITRDVSVEWSFWITAINQSSKPVIAIDVPSGLIADTGAIAGNAIQADITVCFIGLKQGMFTAQAGDVCGEIIFDDLGISQEVYSQVASDARLIKAIDYTLLPERKPSSHKGKFGHVLIAGGNAGMPGAVILTARAALRTGAGLVTIVTVVENLDAISSAVPEAMVKTCDTGSISKVFTSSFVESVTHIAVGMGLGQDDWSLEILRCCIQQKKTMLIDADALNLMTQNQLVVDSSLVLTPHPGEAARLLSEETALSSIDIQHDRFDVVKKIHELFCENVSCVVVLKGSGTLIWDGQSLKVCSLGNAAMAAPGMGDVLSGILVALMAQGLDNSAAAELAVCLHACAAQSITGNKTRGLLASDVIDALLGLLS